jgi:hypothetical protein
VKRAAPLLLCQRLQQPIRRTPVVSWAQGPGNYD